MITEQQREAIDDALERKNITQNALARELGVESGNLSRALGKGMLTSKSIWGKVLDFLDLEIILQPRTPRTNQHEPEAESDAPEPQPAPHSDSDSDNRS